MGRLVRENEMLTYTRGTGENWNTASSNPVTRIAKYGSWTFNSLAWDVSPESNRLINESDFTKKDTNIAFLTGNGRSANWTINGRFNIPLYSLNFKFIGNSTYNSSSTLFKPEYYVYCNKNTTYPSTVTTYNSSGTGTSVSISSFVPSYNTSGCSFTDIDTSVVLGFKLYLLKYGNSHKHSLKPWDYLEYEGDTEDYYDLALSANLKIGWSYINRSYWPKNISTYGSTDTLPGVDYYDGRDTTNASSPIDVSRRIKLGSNIFYTGNYDLMCLELAVLDLTFPSFQYNYNGRLVSVTGQTYTAIKPCISPLAPNVSSSAEQLLCQLGKVNISPYKIITNDSTKGYINNLNTVYAFKSDSGSNVRNHPVWGTFNTYGLFYIIPLVADNPYVYAPTTDLFPLSNNNMGLYFHTGEAGMALPINKFRTKL